MRTLAYGFDVATAPVLLSPNAVGASRAIGTHVDIEHILARLDDQSQAAGGRIPISLRNVRTFGDWRRRHGSHRRVDRRRHYRNGIRALGQPLIVAHTNDIRSIGLQSGENINASRWIAEADHSARYGFSLERHSARNGRQFRAIFPTPEYRHSKQEERRKALSKPSVGASAVVTADLFHHEHSHHELPGMGLPSSRLARSNRTGSAIDSERYWTDPSAKSECAPVGWLD